MVKVLHIKSNVVTDNKPKLPTKEQIEYGEIAVNYAADHETISLKNSEDKIKTFSSDEYYTKQKLGTAFTDSTVTDVLNNELKTKLNVADFNSYSGSVSNNEQVIAGGISELKNEISGKQDKGNYVLKGESYTKAESDTKYLAKTDYDTDKTTMNNKINGKSDNGHKHTLSDITDYKALTSGNGIKIENNVISTTLDTTIFRFVPALPTKDIKENKIYFVPSAVSGQNNTYTEYAYNKGAWEILGQYKADVDLAPYAKTSDVNDKLTAKLDTSTYTNDKKTFALTNDVVDKATYTAYTAATNTSIKGLGKVDDVTVNDKSIVKDKVATIDLTPYAKTADVDKKLAGKADTANTYTKPEVDSKIPTLPKFRTINGNPITGDTIDIKIQAGTSSTPYDDTQIRADIYNLKTEKLDSSAYTPYNDSQIKADIKSLKSDKLDTTAYTRVNTSDFATTANTYTKTEMDKKLADKLNTSDFNTYTADTATKLSNAVKVDDVQVNNKSVVNGKVANIDLSSYAKTSDVSNNLAKKLNIADFNSYSGSVSNNEQVIAGDISELKNEISGKQDKGDYALKGDSYTKADSDDKYLANTAYTADKATFATKTEVTNKLADYAKTSDVTAALKGKQDVLTIDNKLDKTSTNAVQNKAIATELENLMKAISGVLNDINERLNTLSNTVAKQIKNSTE